MTFDLQHDLCYLGSDLLTHALRVGENHLLVLVSNIGQLAAEFEVLLVQIPGLGRLLTRETQRGGATTAHQDLNEGCKNEQEEGDSDEASEQCRLVLTVETSLTMHDADGRKHWLVRVQYMDPVVCWLQNVALVLHHDVVPLGLLLEVVRTSGQVMLSVLICGHDKVNLQQVNVSMVGRDLDDGDVSSVHN